MRINVAVPEAHVEAPVLNAALEATTALNESMLQKGEIPTFSEALAKNAVRWQPEPPGQEHFDHFKRVLARGWGDCDDLAPALAAELRATGEDPGARAIARRSGPKRWHAVVQRSDGRIEDPSKAAGMGSHVGVLGGAVLPIMFGQPQIVGGACVGAFIVKPEIAVRPVRGEYQARADLPWYWREHLWDKTTPTDMAMTSLHTAPTAATALTGAIDGVVALADANRAGNPADLARLEAISDLMAGVPIEAVREFHGYENAAHAQHVVGSFFSAFKKFGRGFGKAFKPFAKIARGVVKFVPGIGPVVDTGLNVAEKAMAKGGINVPWG